MINQFKNTNVLVIIYSKIIVVEKIKSKCKMKTNLFSLNENSQPILAIFTYKWLKSIKFFQIEQISSEISFCTVPV